MWMNENENGMEDAEISNINLNRSMEFKWKVRTFGMLDLDLHGRLICRFDHLLIFG